VDELNKSGIYKILNLVNNKIYIGCATNIQLRWYRHRTDANNQRHHSPTFQRAWNKYGKENFTISVLEYVGLEKLEEREQFYLNELKPYDSNIGYNICKTGTINLGLKRSEEARQNMRNSQLGRQASDETKEKMSEARRDIEKWPCFKGSNCKCDRCKKQRTALAREKRWAKEDLKPTIIKEIKWACPNGIYCKCDKCKKIRNEYNKKRYRTKMGYI
jgi:group I intron endonuclease